MPVFSVGMTCILLVPIPFTVKKPSGATETALSSPKKRTLLPVPAGDRLAVILGTSLFPFVIFGGNFKVIDVGCCLACAVSVSSNSSKRSSPAFISDILSMASSVACCAAVACC